MWELGCSYRNMWEERPALLCSVPSKKEEAHSTLASSLSDNLFKVLLVPSVMSFRGFTLAALWSPSHHLALATGFELLTYPWRIVEPCTGKTQGSSKRQKRKGPSAAETIRHLWFMEQDEVQI